MAVAYYLGGRLGMECGRRWLGGKMNADMQDPAPAPPRTQLAIKSPKVPISYRIRLARGCLTVGVAANAKQALLPPPTKERRATRAN